MVLYNVENISKKPKKDKKWKIWFGQKGPKIWPEGYGFLGKTSPNGSYQNILGWPKLFFDLLKSVPVLDFGPYRHAPKWPISPKMAIFKHVGNNQNVSQELISVHQSIKWWRTKWLSWIRNKFTIFQLCSSWACAEARQSLGSSARSRNSPCSSWKGNSALLINDPDVAGWE